MGNAARIALTLTPSTDDAYTYSNTCRWKDEEERTMGSLSGVLPILPTIFTPKGAIDEAGTRRVVEYIIAAGARGIVFPGLASEYETLSRDERLHMTRLIG